MEQPPPGWEGFELWCEECGWLGDFDDTKGTTECVHCWNDHVTILADFRRNDGKDKGSL